MNNELIDILKQEFGENKIVEALINDEDFLNCKISRNIGHDSLYDYLRRWITQYNYFENIQVKRIHLMDFIFCSEDYQLSLEGVCSDGDFTSIRYILLKTGKVYKMKASKFFHKVTENVPLPEVVKNWIGEVFASKWKAEQVDNSKSYTLHYGNQLSDFMRIYLKGPDSCMVGKEHYSFYVNNVKCTAAWLENKHNDVVARCVIYNEVRDSLDNVYRLAERQYANYPFLKELLIAKLIKANLIDGYKSTNASAGDATKFYLNNGELLLNNYLTISCDLNNNDIISYQDSFKFYNDARKEAYNYNPITSLETTDIRISGLPFLKCPNCGKYFNHRKLIDSQGIYYCCNKCLQEGKNLYYQDKRTYHLYVEETRKRVRTCLYPQEDGYEYQGVWYLGHYTEVNGKKVPSERIIQVYSKSNKLLREYEDIDLISSKYKKCQIVKCCRGSIKTAYGFIWRYKE